MRKNDSVLWLFLILLSGGMLFSCARKEEDSHYRLIPENAVAVVSIEAEALLHKSAVAEKVIPLLEEIADSDKGMGKALDILHDTRESGISFKDRPAFFLLPDLHQWGGVAQVSDAGKLEALFKLLNQQGITRALESSGDFRQVLTATRDLLFLFNDRHLLVLPYTGPATGEYGRLLFAQERSASILSRATFYNKQDDPEDLSCYLSPEPIHLLLSHGDFPDVGIDFSRLSLHLGLTFKPGCATLSSQLRTDDPETQKRLETIGGTFRKSTRSHLGYFPSAPLLLSMGNVNGPAIVTLQKELFGTLSGLVESALREEGIEETIGMAQALMGGVDGEVTLGITGLSPMSLPNLLLYADIANDMPLRLIDQVLLPQSGITANRRELAPNQYRCDLTIPGMSVYYGKKGNLFYLTTSSGFYERVGQKHADPFSESEQARLIPEDIAGYTTINLKAVLQNPLVALGAGSLIDPEIFQLFGLLQSLELVQRDCTQAEFNLRLVNQEENALAVLARLFSPEQLFEMP